MYINNEKINESTSYYKNQLNGLDLDTEYYPSVQIKCNGESTKWFDLNDESVPELIKWLKDNKNKFGKGKKE